MARLTTYTNQSPSDNDLLTGSEYMSFGNYKTGNYKLVDLAAYFASFQIQNGTGFNLATMSQSISTNATETSANATLITSLTASVNLNDGNIALKPSIFRQDAAPSTTNLANGSLWYDTNDGNKLYVLTAGAWVATADTRIASNVTGVTSNASNIAANVSSLALRPRVFRQDAEPPVVGIPANSLWYDTNDDNKLYIFNGSSWVLTDDSRIGNAVSSLAIANETIVINATNISAEATKITELESQFVYTNGSITEVAGALATSITTTATSAAGSVAADLNKLEAVFSFDSNGDVNGMTPGGGLATAVNTSANAAITNASLASAASVTTLTSNLNLKPDIFRQDDAPDVTEAVGSIWYDTDDNNKVYILVAGSPNVWTLTSDDRIVVNSQSISTITQNATTLSDLVGAEAVLVDELQTQFTFDTGGGITGTADALATSITTAQSNAETASAGLVTKLQSNIGTFDASGNLTSLSTSFANSVMSTENTTDYAEASNLNTLSAVLGIDSTDGSQSTQATAIVNGATTSTTTATVSGAVDSSENLVITAANSNIEVGQFLTGNYISTTSYIRVKAISGTAITLDSKISISNSETVTFTGTATITIDNISGTIRPGLVVKGTGLTVGTSVVSVSGTTLVLSKAESIVDNTALTFLGIYAAVDQTAAAIANIDGTISASYGLKVDANGNIASMNFFADDTSSEVSFSADSFKVFNGTAAESPFEVSSGVVKIKTANIGNISFGDISDAPSTTFTSVVYASDASGTSPSFTKGTRTFYAIYQGAAQIDLTSSSAISALTFNQITGSTGSSGADAKVVKLSSSALVVKYDSEGNNPDPSTITLTGSSTAFADGFFKFTGGGSHFTDETTFTDGSAQNQDTATITVPSTFAGFGSPLSMRVGVSEGDQTESAFDTINIAPVKAGSNGLTILLSNDSHSVPASSNGTVSSFTGSGTDIVVFDGATEYNSVAHNATPGNNEFKVTTSVTTGTITVGAQNISANKVTFADHSAMSSDLAIIEYTINVENTTTIKKYQTLNKSKQGLVGAIGADGSAGSNARAVNLTSEDLSFEYTAAGATPSPTSVTVTATALNTTGTVFYEFFLNDVSTGTATTTNTYTYTPKAAYADMPEKVEVQIKEGAANAAIVARDQTTMFGIKPGATGLEGVSPYAVILTNEAHTLPATGTATNAATYTGSGTDVQVYKGITQLNSVTGTPTAGQFKVTATATNITTGAQTITGNPAVFADHSAMTANNATISFSVNCEGTATIVKVQALSKSIKGDGGNDGTNGTNGTNGAAGAAGATGPTGPTGLTGAIGADGSAGSNARTVNLIADDLSFEYTAAGSSPSPSTATVTANSLKMMSAQVQLQLLIHTHILLRPVIVTCQKKLRYR